MGTDRDEYTLESGPRCVQIADPKGYGSSRSSVNDYLFQNWHGSIWTRSGEKGVIATAIVDGNCTSNSNPNTNFLLFTYFRSS